MTDLATSSAAEIIERYWNQQPLLKRGAVASQAEIAAFESEHGVRLPEDFAEYLARLNGIPSSSDPDSWEGVDAEGFEFNPLSKLVPMPEAPGYFIFCSWVLGLLPFSICLDAGAHCGKIIASRGGLGESRVVASSFTSFAQLYVDDSMQLYGAKAPDA